MEKEWLLKAHLLQELLAFLKSIILYGVSDHVESEMGRRWSGQ
jgi:hypothetical protein